MVEDITQLDPLQRAPWNSGYLQGIVDAPFLNLTPGTRTGIIHDDTFDEFNRSLDKVEQIILKAIDQQRKAEEERTSRHLLRTIQKAFKEALLALPVEEYNWFEIHTKGEGSRPRPAGTTEAMTVGELQLGPTRAYDSGELGQKQFFEYAGPLFSVRITPASCVVPVGQAKNLRAIARDRSRHLVEHDVEFSWEVVEGNGALEDSHCEIVTFNAPHEPGLTRIKVTATQGSIHCEGEAIITITESLLPEPTEPSASKLGLPGYTFERAPGALWRSKYDANQNVIVINNGHRDFVYASRSKALKLRYIARLFAKEMVYKNFPGYPADQLLERLIELSLYTEENLK